MEPVHYITIGLLIVFVIAMITSARLIQALDNPDNFEVRKIRFAAVTFTGIMVLLLVIGILSILEGSDNSAAIFEKVITGLSPIAGGIVGYLFASKQ